MLEETIKEEKPLIENFFIHLKDYAEERLNLIVLNLTEKISKSVSGIAAVLVVSVISIFALLFLSTAVAWWIGQAIRLPFIGFFIVAAFYIIVALLLYANREKWLFVPVANLFLKHIGDEEED